LDKHLDNNELDALVPSPCENGQAAPEFAPARVHDARRHAEQCAECAGKLQKYRQLVQRLSNGVIPEAAGDDCPNLNEDDWREVAAGLWPESKAGQLITHAALCDHCGPLLRRSVSVDRAAEEPSRERKSPSQVGSVLSIVPVQSVRLTRWLAPTLALGLIVGVLGSRPWSSPRPLSGPTFADFAVRTHRQHAQGKLVLDLRSGSQRVVNEWLRAKSPFSVALPVSLTEAGEQRPYDLEGAQLVRVGGKTAALIAYQVKMPKLQTAASSLLVTPDSVAVASGGVEVDFKKVSFHYVTIEGYKVVTWSVHGLTYALVSEEGNNTQRSCMVCHSAIKDRDLSQTTAPLRSEGKTSHSVWH
jgi:anti-sigma factor RsiW